MARRKIYYDGEGMMGHPPVFIVTEDGKVTPELITQINTVFQEIYMKMNDGMSWGSGIQSGKMGNHVGQWIEFTSPSIADIQFAVPHGLGVRPVGYWPVRNDKAGQLYDSNGGGWSINTVYFKSSVASKLYKIALIA